MPLMSTLPLWLDKRTLTLYREGMCSAKPTFHSLSRGEVWTCD